MGIFNDLDRVPVNEQRPYFEPGIYEVNIDKFRLNNGSKGLSLALCATVEKNISPFENGVQQGLPVGSSCVQIITLAGDPIKAEMGRKAMMTFLCTIYQCRPADYTSEQWEDIIVTASDNGDFEGTKMRLTVFITTTKVKKEPFTIHNWALLTE